MRRARGIPRVRRAVRAGAGRDPGRRQLPGAGVQRGRRHPPVHRLRQGRVADRRRRPRVRRPDLLVGADAARARAPRGRGGGARGGGSRYVVRHADPARGGAGRGDRGPHAGRAGPVRLVRHRGDDVGDPAGPRLHRSRRGREVRRLLPRSRRLAAGLGRLGRRHVRHPWHSRRTCLVDRADPRAALQRPGRCREGVRRARRPDRLPDHRGRPRQHGRGPARAGVQRLPGRDLPQPRRAVRQRRGDDRASGPPGSASGVSTAPRRAGAPT